jgi:hypothetical protein
LGHPPHLGDPSRHAKANTNFISVVQYGADPLDLAGEITVGEEIVMRGYGANVWWSDAVGHRDGCGEGQALEDFGWVQRGLLNLDWCVEAKSVRPSKDHEGKGGKPDDVARGRIMLGAAKPVKLQNSVDYCRRAYVFDEETLFL